MLSHLLCIGSIFLLRPDGLFSNTSNQLHSNHDLSDSILPQLSPAAYSICSSGVSVDENIYFQLMNTKPIRQTATPTSLFHVSASW